MKTKYWNEYTNEVFDTEEEAIASEKKYLELQAARKKAEAEREAARKKKDSERAERAKQVNEAAKKLMEAKKNYHKVLADFCKDYGAYHCSSNEPDLLEALLDEFEIF